MKPARIAIALSMVVLATAASAQSSMSMFGVLDVGYLHTRPDSGPAIRELADGIQAPSRVGLRGSEGLGQGRFAGFVLEAGFAVDSGHGQSGGRLFGRQAWASLGAPVGEIRLGRQYGLGYEFFLSDTSPFAAAYRDAGTGGVFSSASDRMILDNVAMVRAGPYGGVLAAAGYSFNASGPEAAGASGNARAWTAGARYRGSNLYLALAYDNVQCPDTATGTAFNACNAVTRDHQSNLQVGGSYEFAPVRIYAMWGLERNQFTFVAVAPAKKAIVYEAGVKIRLLGGELLAAYQGRDDDWDANLDVWGVGYSYPLSRRTNIYTFLSDTRADDSPAGQLVSAGRIVREGYTASQITSYRERDRMQFGVGVRHNF